MRMKRSREAENHYTIAQHTAKKAKLNHHNNSINTLNQHYQDCEIPKISNISLSTAKNPANTIQSHTHFAAMPTITDEFKYESHPIHPNTQVISLISDDEADEEIKANYKNSGTCVESRLSLRSPTTSSTSSGSSSAKETSSDLYEKDAKGYLVFHAGLVILGKYKLVRALGKGTFSRVFECHHVDSSSTKKSKQRHKKGAITKAAAAAEASITASNGSNSNSGRFAVKVIRAVYKYQVAAETELQVLRRIKQSDPLDKSNCIHLHEDNKYRGHPILVFPLFGRSVYSFMVDNRYKPFCYDDVIDIMHQLLVGVSYIHSLSIIVTDLKPENVVLVNDEIDRHRINLNSTCYLSPKCTQIKLIDFGSAVIHEHGLKHTHLIQTRHYRAPEVVFKLPWTFSADLWSVGCILIELVYGKMLFNTHCNIDHLNQMVKCIDAPPSALLDLIDDNTWNDFFDSRGALNMYKAKRSPVQCKKLSKYFLDIHSNAQSQMLYDLATKLLCWNPGNRLTAKQALNHPVFQRYHNQ